MKNVILTFGLILIALLSFSQEGAIETGVGINVKSASLLDYKGKISKLSDTTLILADTGQLTYAIDSAKFYLYDGMYWTLFETGVDSSLLITNYDLDTLLANGYDIEADTFTTTGRWDFDDDVGIGKLSDSYYRLDVLNDNTTIFQGGGFKVRGGYFGAGLDTIFNISNKDNQQLFTVMDNDKTTFHDDYYFDGVAIKNYQETIGDLETILRADINTIIQTVGGGSINNSISIGGGGWLGITSNPFIDIVNITNHGESSYDYIHKAVYTNNMGFRNFVAKSDDRLNMHHINSFGVNNLFEPGIKVLPDTLDYEYMNFYGFNNGSILNDSSHRVGLYGSNLLDSYDGGLYDSAQIFNNISIFGWKKEFDFTNTMEREGTMILSNDDTLSYLRVNVDKIYQNDLEITLGSVWNSDADTIYTTKQVVIGGTSPDSTEMLQVDGDAIIKGELNISGNISGANIINPLTENMYFGKNLTVEDTLEVGYFEIPNTSSIATTDLTFGGVVIFDSVADIRELFKLQLQDTSETVYKVANSIVVNDADSLLYIYLGGWKKL